MTVTRQQEGSKRETITSRARWSHRFLQTLFQTFQETDDRLVSNARTHYRHLIGVPRWNLRVVVRNFFKSSSSPPLSSSLHVCTNLTRTNRATEHVEISFRCKYKFSASAHEHCTNKRKGSLRQTKRQERKEERDPGKERGVLTVAPLISRFRHFRRGECGVRGDIRRGKGWKTCSRG